MPSDESRPAEVIDLESSDDGRGVLLGFATDDLNVNLVQWGREEGVDAHVNGERDVVFIGVSGSALVTVDGEEIDLAADRCIIVPRGAERAIRSGPVGVRYLTVHRRREPLTLGSAKPA